MLVYSQFWSELNKNSPEIFLISSRNIFVLAGDIVSEVTESCDHIVSVRD